jgi:hypothetical protein
MQILSVHAKTAAGHVIAIIAYYRIDKYQLLLLLYSLETSTVASFWVEARALSERPRHFGDANSCSTDAVVVEPANPRFRGSK